MRENSHSWRVGGDLGPYRFRRLLGRGVLGEVYEAENTATERTVALKLVSRELGQDPVFRARLQRAVQATARLHEPHVVPIHDFGEVDGQLFLDMRLIDGIDLMTLLKRNGPLTVPRAVAIIRQVAAALDAGHAAGLVHGGVKPENILISSDDFAYVVDFGITRALAAEDLVRIDTASCKYMAPEQLARGAVDDRADNYALACVLYECLIGSAPYAADDLAALISAILTAPIPRPSQQRPQIPVEIDGVIARGMAKNAQDRYASNGDLAMAAQAALGTRDQAYGAATSSAPTAAAPSSTYAAPPRHPQPPAAAAPTWQSAQAAMPPQAEASQPHGKKPRGSKQKQRAAKTKKRRAAQPSLTTAKDTGDRLSSSVFAPPAVHSGDNFLVYVFAHVPEDEALVQSLARKYYARAEPRGSVGLNKHVREGDSLTFQMLLPDMVVDEPIQSMVWFGRAESVQFGVTVPPDFTPRDIWGTIRISRNSVPLGHLKFNMSVHVPSPTRASSPEPVARQEMHRYNRAFISYASADRNEVLKRAQMLSRNHIDFFQDILSLDPGERWERRLYREIDRCDVFYLFWSSAAKKSPWVLKEVRYAMERNGGDELGLPEILPIIIEGPPPVEPPPELAHLHFNDQIVYFIQPTKKSWFSVFRLRDH